MPAETAQPPHRHPFLLLALLWTFLAFTALGATPDAEERRSRCSSVGELALDGDPPARTVVEGRTFRGTFFVPRERTTYLRCTFDGAGMPYCVVVPDGLRGTLFVECTFRGARGKGIKASWVGVRDSLFTGIGEDAVFLGPPGYLEFRGNRVEKMGWGHGHSDGIQVSAARIAWILDNEFVMPHGVPTAEGELAWVNACVYAESDFGPIQNLRVDRNRLDGGLYSLWVRDGNFGLPRGVQIRHNRFYRHFYAPSFVDPRVVPPALLELENDFSEATRFRP